MTTKESFKALIKLKNNRDKYEKAYHKKISEIQKDCEHNWVYYPDPSGNNDSGYCCSGCSLWVKRLP